jgi:type II secretion system protein N
MKERALRLFKLALKYGAYVGYPAFYCLSLAVFAAITFPYDKLKQRVVATFNAEQQTSATPQELQIDEMSGYWLSGVRMKGVRLLSSSTEPGKAPSKLQIDEATVRYGMLAGLIGHTSMSFDAYAFGGEVYGSYAVSGKDKSLDITLDAIDLGEIDPVVQTLGVPVQGKLSGTVKLALPEGKASKGSGAISLEAKNVAVGDGKAKIKGALALPKLDVGTLTLAAEAKDGALKITKLAAGGKDVELQGDGRVTMRDTAGESLCDAQARFKINDGYRSKNDITKSLFGTPGSNAPALFELADPKVKQSKRADGFYAWTLRGPIAKIEFIPAGGAMGMNPGVLGLPRPTP